MTVSTESDVKKFLNSIELEAIGRPLSKVGRVLEVSVSGDKASARIELGIPAKSALDSIRAQIESELCAHTGAASADVEL